MHLSNPSDFKAWSKGGYDSPLQSRLCDGSKGVMDYHQNTYEQRT